MSSVAPDITKTALKRDGKFQSLPSYQANGQVFTPSVRNLPSEYPSTIFNAAQKYISKIPRIDNIDHLLLRIQLTLSNVTTPMVLTPVNYWFRETSLRQGAEADLIQTQYDDSNQANLLTVCTAGRERAIFKTANMEYTTNGKYGVTKPLLAGTYTYWVPVLSSVFAALQGVYLDNLVGDLYLDLTTSSTIVASGAGTITANISFDVEGVRHLSAWDKQEYTNLYKQTAFEAQYLQPFRSEFLNTTLTAGNVNNLTLDTVDGLCSHQMILIRPTGCYSNNAGFASWKLLNVGDSNGASLDLVSSSGESYIGGARPTRFIRQHQAIDNMDNEFWSVIPAYHLVYCDNIRAALSGMVKGARWFKSQNRDQIRLTLPAAPVSEVQTITFSAVPAAGGFYAFSYKGDMSAQLPVNASPATMQAAIQAMKTFAARYITVTCSASASAGTSFTVTFTDPQGEFVGDLLEVLSHDGLAASASTARTVAAVPGLVSGQYDVVVYSYIYRVACYNGTKLRTKLMLE